MEKCIDLINQRIKYLTEEKFNVLTDFSDYSSEDFSVYNERVSRINHEIRFLNILILCAQNPPVEDKGKCKRSGCDGRGVCDGYCAAHCNCLA